MAIKKGGGFVTVQQLIMNGQEHYPTASGEFSWLLSAITLSTKIIASYVRRAGLVDIGGYTEDTNVQGEIQHQLDVIANDTLKRTLGYRGSVGVIASEEDDEPRVLLKAEKGGKYIVMFDPLDGSSNIDTCVPVGTIFTVLRNPPEIESTEKSVLQPGTEQLAAGYVLYGSSTVLVLTTGHGVNIFTLDPQFGAFLLVREDVMMPQHTKQYSINEAYAHTFPPAYGKYLEHAKDQGFSSRYIGSLVADFHRILIKGGVFLYPQTKANPDGKLRLMYEANPLAFIAEQAGGVATSGSGRIMEMQPDNVHGRTPLVIGSKGNVDEVMGFVNAAAAATT